MQHVAPLLSLKKNTIVLGQPERTGLPRAADVPGRPHPAHRRLRPPRRFDLAKRVQVRSGLQLRSRSQYLHVLCVCENREPLQPLDFSCVLFLVVFGGSPYSRPVHPVSVQLSRNGLRVAYKL